MTMKSTKRVLLYLFISVVLISVTLQTNLTDNEPHQENEFIDLNSAVIQGNNPSQEIEYITQDSSLHNYSEIGNWVTTGETRDVVVDGNWAFVADGSNGMRVINITDKTNPVEYGVYKNGSAICYEVYKNGDYLFLAYGINGFIVLDLSLSLVTPPPVASFHSNQFGGYECNSIDVEDDWTYLTFKQYGLVLFNTTNPDNPVYESRFTITGINANDVDVYNNFAYIADVDFGIRKINYNNKQSPSQYTTYASGSSSSIYVYNDFWGFVADYNGFFILNIASFPILKKYEFADGNHANGVYMTKETAFVTYSGNNGMKIFNVTDRENGKFIGQFDDPGDCYNVVINEDYAYVCDGTSGLEIVQLDTDSDGIYDGYEIYDLLTNETDPDTDGDLIEDGDEFYGYYSAENPYSNDTGNYFRELDPLNNDSDFDLIDDYEEIILGADSYFTDPENNDTDGDNLSDYEEVSVYFTNPTKIDSDGDTITDGEEVNDYGTDPNKSDSDSDGMPDGYEIFFELNPIIDDADLDKDSDLISNIDEYNVTLTNPNNNDTDNDLLTDGEEVYGYYAPTHPYSNGTGYILTNAPKNADIDTDNLKDGEEIKFYDTNPFDADSDDDNVNDYEEVITHLTNPNDNDTDGDGLNDWWETYYGTNPLLDDTSADPDGDTLTNQEEFDLGTNPTNSDTDGDGINDDWEIDNLLDPLDETDFEDDFDTDGLSNYEEYLIGTDPNDEDTDQDGMDDFWESESGTNPLVDDANEDPDQDGLLNIDEMLNDVDPLDEDYDNDGLLDGEEVNIYGTNPKRRDTDGDSYSDYEEIQSNTDPLDPNSNPVLSRRYKYIAIGSSIAAGIVILLVVFFIVFWTTRPEQKLFKILATQKSIGTENMSLKELTVSLDKKLNRGEIKQLINEFSDSKKLTLDGNRVWLTSIDEIQSNIKRYTNWITQSKSKVITASEKRKIIDQIKHDISMCDKLNFTEEANELTELLEEIK